MTWQLFPAREHFPAFAAEWDRLNAALYASHPMFDSRFIGPLLDHFGKGDELLCVHRTGDSFDGALILRPLGLGRWALFLPSQMQAGALMFKDAQLLETLLPALPGYAWSLDLLCIDPLYAPDWTRLRLPRIVVPHTYTMAVSTQGSFADYWHSRPKHLIRSIRRYRRRAEETAGTLSLATHTWNDAITAALARYERLESTGRKDRTGTAIAPDNIQGRFYGDILTRFSATGQARVMELYAGVQLVASRLLISHETMWIILKTTYDESQPAIAPGRLLLHAALEHFFAEIPDGSIEFYTNVSRDQAAWATSLRPIPHQQILRSDIATGLLFVTKTIRNGPRQLSHANGYDPLTIHCYHNIASLPPNARTLFEQAESQYPEFAAGWFDNLQQTVYPDDPGVRYYVAERAGQPVAILPVRLARYGIVRRVESLGNFYTSLYSPILAPEATELDIAALLRAASRDHGDAHEMRFAPMDPASPAYAAMFAALRSIGWISHQYFCFGNWFLSVNTNWASYFANRPGELRSAINRKGKKFAAAGGTLEIIIDPAQAEAAIDDYNHVYSRSWKRSEPYPDFIPGLIRWLAAKGWLKLGIARLDGHPIAAQLWIISHGRANIFKLAYDDNFRTFGAGTLLNAHMMEYSISKSHVKEIDFLIGDDEHKKSWMNERRERWGIIAHNPKLPIGLALAAQEYLTRLVRPHNDMNISNKDTAALVIGLCSHGLSVARSLAKAGIPTYAVEKDMSLAGTRTNSVLRIFRVPSFSEHELIDSLVKIRKELSSYKTITLMPINDSHVKTIGENWRKLEKAYKLSWGSCIDGILKLQRKDELEKICTERKLYYPKSVTITSTNNLESLVAGFEYPLIIKPVKPMSSFKTHKAYDINQLQSLIRIYEGDLPILCQEYIKGGDESIFFAELIQHNGKTLATMSGRKLLSYPPAMGQAIIAQTCDAPEVIQIAEAFFSGLSLSGPLALEVKRDSKNRYWVIEPTVGRTEFLVELCIKAGFDLPIMEYKLSIGQNIYHPTAIQPTIWFDTERSPSAYFKTVIKCKSLHPYGQKPVFPYLSASDLRPFFSQIQAFVKRTINKLFHPNA